MHQPQKGRSSEQSKVKATSDQEMIGNLAKGMIEVLNDDSQKIEEPFENYVLQLRMRLYKDVKNFRSRLIRGYEGLFEQLRSKKNT